MNEDRVRITVRVRVRVRVRIGVRVGVRVGQYILLNQTLPRTPD